MDFPPDEELTRMLAESGIGDRGTLTELLPHVHDELRRVRPLSDRSLPTCCQEFQVFNRRRERRRGRRIPVDYVYDYVHVVCERSEPFTQGGAVNEPR